MSITWKILFLELAIILFCFLGILIIRLFIFFRTRHRERDQNTLKNILSKSIQEEKVIGIKDIPSNLRNFKNVFFIVESFDHYFLDKVWVETKLNLLNEYLIPYASKYIKSSSWQKRQIALRVFSLKGLNDKEEKDAFKLLNDPVFLVRIAAAKALMLKPTAENIKAIIEQMARESPLARYPFRDILLNSPLSVYGEMEKILQLGNHDESASICLDILAEKISGNLSKVAQKYSSSANEEIRASAVKLLSQQPESKNLLFKALKDPSKKVRQESIKGLKRYHDSDVIEEMVKILNDPDWEIRYEAATAIKSMGNTGVNALINHKHASVEAKEIADYVLAKP